LLDSVLNPWRYEGAEARTGAIVVSCGLAGLSALGAHYAGGLSFQGPQFGVGDPFPLLHLLIRQLWKDGEDCNRTVEVDCSPGFTAASIKNGVIAYRATDATGH
jgi:hypothetical protein